MLPTVGLLAARSGQLGIVKIAVVDSHRSSLAAALLCFYMAADLHCFYMAADLHCFYMAADLHCFYMAADLHCFYMAAEQSVARRDLRSSGCPSS
jgi:hypothetical protein